MTVLGVDFDTRAVHAVLLDDDTNRATYVPVPFVDHKPPFRFEDARGVRVALLDAIFRTAKQPVNHPRYFHGWESIHLVGIEKPYSQSRTTIWNYGLIVGAILATVPRGLSVIEVPPQEWKQLTVGKANASKDDVRRWARSELWYAESQDTSLTRPTCDREQWPQDAMDAYAIARAVRALNERAAA